MSSIERGSIRVQGFSDAEMDFQLLRQLGASTARAASAGESLHLAAVISDNDPARWVEAFTKQAIWQQKDGLERLHQNHVISGREQLWKASQSYRAAEYYAPPATPQQARLGQHSADCFLAAMATTDFYFERHSIEYDSMLLPVYFVSPADDGKCRPTVMIVSGFDGTLEEEFLMRGMAAVERGYNVIHFAGPGQMDVFRNNPETAFQPDYETITTKVIDFFSGRHEIDWMSLSLMGISFGGYFAIRASLGDSRIKRLIANSPILDLHAYLCAFSGMDPAQMPETEDFSLDDLPNIPEEEISRQLAAQCAQLMIRFGRRSFRNTFIHLRDYRVDQSLLAKLDIPCLALIGASEGIEPKQQCEQFVRLTQADKFEFTSHQGASTHCQVGNVNFANAVVYDWLDTR